MEAGPSRPAADALRLQRPLCEGAEQGRGRPLPRHVAQHDPQAALPKVEVVEEVAADGPARQGLGRRRKERPRPAARREQGLLDVGRGLHLLVEARLLERSAVQLGVLDGHRGFVRQRLERASGRRGKQRPLLPAVEVQHADTALARRIGRGVVCVADQPQRGHTGRAGSRAPRFPGAHPRGRRRGDRPRCASSPVRNTSSGILRLVWKPLPGSGCRSRDRPIVNSSRPPSSASMMKPRSAPLTAMAESITSTSTSSSTRAELSARNPSSSTATCRRSPIVSTRRDGGWVVSSAAQRKVSSAPPRPRRTRAPSSSGPSRTGAPSTKVPWRDPQSRMAYPSPAATISACTRDTSPLVRSRSFPAPRPRRNGSLSTATVRWPVTSVTSSCGSAIDGHPTTRGVVRGRLASVTAAGPGGSGRSPGRFASTATPRSGTGRWIRSS